MNTEHAAPELAARWSSWLQERNVKGTKASLTLVLALYPGFGVLDYFVAPEGWLWLLLATRVVVTLVTAGALAASGTEFFRRHVQLIAAGFQVLISGGISLMTLFMGGMESPYYAGLSLIMVGIGLLFVWSKPVVIGTNIAIIASFVVPNLIWSSQPLTFAAMSNLFFLVSTAVVASVGQLVAYRTLYEQVASQLVIETTKANLEVAHDRLKQLDQFKSEFFANITHELKTPLTMILAPLELMLQGESGKVTDAQRASLDSMLRNGVKLLKLIGDLLDLSRLNESRLRLRLDDQDIVAYLRGLVSQVDPMMQRKSISMSFASDVATCVVACDLDRLERVFVNLLSNAAKFTPPTGRVTVTLEDKGDDVRVSVRDTGIGFPPEKADALFERFFQVDMAGTRKFGGTGIGLALAKELVELHAGTIAAHSGPEGGATFVVTLPKHADRIPAEHVDRRARAEDRVEGQRSEDHGIGEWQVEAASKFRLIEIDEVTEQRIAPRDPDEQARGQTVLVVEDTADVIRVISAALRSRFRVLAATGGEKGLELAIAHQPSLVITDWMMPGMDGLELSQRLRQDPRTRHIPIVLLTARGGIEDKVAGLQSGVNAYLTKPFSAQELLATVRGLVRIQETTADLVMTHNMDSLETVAGGLAHELNNPLNYVRSAFSLLQADAHRLALATPDGPDDVGGITTRMQRLFDLAEGGLRRMGTTVELMQRYAREGYTRALQPYDLFAGVRDVAAMLQAGRERQLVHVDLVGDATVQCVPEELHQAITNVIQNAIDAVPSDDSGAVRVIGSVDGSHVTLRVRDNGPGIAPDLRDKIFTPFFTTKDVGKGMGLGLSIVRRVVLSHGGTIEIDNRNDGGCEVTLRLPRLLRDGHRNDTLAAQVPND